MKNSLIYDSDGFLMKEPPSLTRLRRLIGKMSASEKTSFKRYIRNYRDNNKNSKCIQLFDCVNDCLLDVEQEVRTMELSRGI